jgi:hypothetical protein
MSQNNGSATAMTAASNGRPIKFTPERFEQIKTLVERGMLREQIAETIGVTLGSLQVTCSRVGISLRRPRPPGRAAPVRRQRQPAAADHEKPAALGPSTAMVGVKLSHEHRALDLKLPHDLLGGVAIGSALRKCQPSPTSTKSPRFSYTCALSFSSLRTHQVTIGRYQNQN